MFLDKIINKNLQKFSLNKKVLYFFKTLEFNIIKYLFFKWI